LSIVTYPDNPRVWKALIAAKYNGVEVNLKSDFKMGETNKTASFLSVNPFGQVPTAFSSDRTGVFESNSILRYVARVGEKKKNLYGKDALEQSRVDAFLDAIVSLESVAGPWFYKLSKYPFAANFHRSYIDRCIDFTKKSYIGWNEALKEKQFLVGDSLTIADIAWFASSWPAFSKLLDAEFRKQIPHAVKHFRKLEELAEFKAVAGGPVKFPDTVEAPEYDEKATPAARFHRLVTIARGDQKVKFKFYADSQSQDIQNTIRSRFGLSHNTKFVLSDEEGFDVVVDGTLETGTYKLTVSSEV